MSSQQHALVEAIDRIYHIVPSGAWPLSVYEFLKRPATLEFIAGFREETNKPTNESILILLAAMRYIDLRNGAEPGLSCILEEPHTPTNFDQFLEHYHDELLDLCRTRHVQGNTFERAFPVMELLAQCHGEQSLAVIELGCSYGMIGRALCSADKVLAQFNLLCEPDQQRPTTGPRVTTYRGVDLSIPDATWFLACMPFADSRRRNNLFLKAIALNEDFRLITGSAFDFSGLPEIADLLPRFGMDAVDRLVPVVLTSFMLYQFSMDERRKLTELIQAFVAPRGGTWVNLDLTPTEGSYHFYVAQDGVERIVLENDLCKSWRFV